MRLNLHARIEIAIIAMLLLGSCGSESYRSEFSDAEMDEISDIAGDACADAIADDETIADLQSRVSDIESRLSI